MLKRNQSTLYTQWEWRVKRRRGGGEKGGRRKCWKAWYESVTLDIIRMRRIMYLRVEYTWANRGEDVAILFVRRRRWRDGATVTQEKKPSWVGGKWAILLCKSFRGSWIAVDPRRCGGGNDVAWGGSRMASALRGDAGAIVKSLRPRIA